MKLFKIEVHAPGASRARTETHWRLKQSCMAWLCGRHVTTSEIKRPRQQSSNSLTKSLHASRAASLTLRVVGEREEKYVRSRILCDQFVSLQRTAQQRRRGHLHLGDNNVVLDLAEGHAVDHLSRARHTVDVGRNRRLNWHRVSHSSPSQAIFQPRIKARGRFFFCGLVLAPLMRARELVPVQLTRPGRFARSFAREPPSASDDSSFRPAQVAHPA
jgi:hypothetical protein